MKRAISAVLLLTLFLARPLAVSADYEGDKWLLAGHYYYSDTEVYVRGYRINSYNIGGKSAIIASDLNWYFDFYVEWDAQARATKINDRWLPEGYADEKTGRVITYYSANDLNSISDIGQQIANLPADYAQKAKGPRGKMAGNVYHTDIKAYLNGNEIKSYNIDGRTAILCEDFRDYGYDVIWDEKNRRTAINEHRTGKPLETDMGAYYLREIRYSDEGFEGYLRLYPPKTAAVLADDIPVSEIPVIHYSGLLQYRLYEPDYFDFYYVPVTDFLEIAKANPGKKLKLDFKAESGAEKAALEAMMIYAPEYEDWALVYENRLYVMWDILVP